MADLPPLSGSRLCLGVVGRFAVKVLWEHEDESPQEHADRRRRPADKDHGDYNDKI